MDAPTQYFLASTMYAVSWEEMPQQSAPHTTLEVTGYLVRAINAGSGHIEDRAASYGSTGQFIVGVDAETTYVLSVAARNTYGTGTLSASLNVTTAEAGSDGGGGFLGR